MKAILLHRTPCQPISTPPCVDIIVDSAIVLPGRPLFLPDCAPAFHAVICPAIRVSRLGKDIVPKFASRYYDAITLTLRLIPQGWPDTGALSGLFDNALALGQWLPLADEYTIGEDSSSVTISSADLLADEALAAVSAYATIKQGDIIMPCHLPTPPSSLTLGTNVTLTLNSTPCLNVRIR